MMRAKTIIFLATTLLGLCSLLFITGCAPEDNALTQNTSDAITTNATTTSDIVTGQVVTATTGSTEAPAQPTF